MIKKVSLIIWIFIICSCTTFSQDICNLPCELDINQANSITAQDFINVLSERDWIESNQTNSLQGTYARDEYSNVLETTTTLAVSNNEFTQQIDLYIGNIGTVQLNHHDIPAEEIEAIRVYTNMTILESLLIYGFPEGGRILPYFTESDLSPNNPCPNRSHYIAYYDEGQTVVRATIARPIFENIWSTDVEIFYPIGDSLEFSRNHSGNYERLDHIPCFPN